jgi:hypothetical protein
VSSKVAAVWEQNLLDDVDTSVADVLQGNILNVLMQHLMLSNIRKENKRSLNCEIDLNSSTPY